MHTQHNRYLPFLMWLFPLIFFAWQFILRLWPGLMMDSLMLQFSIDASGFGLIAAFYYYGYAGMQIPVALFLERYGARWVIAAFVALCGIAMYIFTHTDNFYLALASRFLIGAGSAAGFLGVSKVVSDWFPASRYASMIGFSFSIGLMGAIFGGKPVSMLISAYGSEWVAGLLVVTAIVLSACCMLVLRNPKHNDHQDGVKLRDFSTLFSSPLIWLLALVNLLLVGSLEGFADAWGIPWLMVSLQLEKSDAALLVSFIFFGMLAGGPLLALFKNRFGNYWIIAFCGFGITAIFTALLCNVIHSSFWLATLFFTTGILCCYQVLVFSAGADMVASKYLGVIVAFLNCINMLGGSFFHTIIGRVMDGFWQGTMNDQGMRIYELTSFQYALSVIPACALIGGLLTLWIGKQSNRTSE